jgi:predicted nucleotidyltransferase
MKQQLIKNTIKLGNSSAVILPNTWKYKKVKIQLVEESITEDILEILLKSDLLKQTIGIYLVGSYARNEETEDSDIDLLIITDSIDKQVKQGIYEIIFISKKKFKERIGKSLYLTSLVRESKSLMNNEFIKEYKEIGLKLSLKEYLKEIKSMIKINKQIIDLDEETEDRVIDGTVYSVILRLRELYFLNCFKNKKEWNKKQFLELIGDEKIYDAYLRIKNDKKTKDDSLVKDVKKVLETSEKLVKKLENGTK